MKRIKFLLLVSVLFFVEVAYAQDGNDPVSYSNLALQFSTHNFNGDAATGMFPSVAFVNGYGSFVDNPAGIALVDQSYFNFGMVNNQVEFENSYLNNTVKTSDNSTKLGNIGFVYKIPTERGSFVLGGGYNRLAYQSGINRVSVRNNESTITDVFKDFGNSYHDIAYNAYAIEWANTDSTYKESIFRIDLEEYPGITQEAKISYQTDVGEYSFFFGTEFQKDLYIGVSAGLLSGTYTYRRDFLEIDNRDDYNYNFLVSPESGDSTDIHSILVHDEIDADIMGFSLRAGLIYKISPNLNIGLSYLLPSTIIVREGYYSSIDTEFDDGTSPTGFYDTSFGSESDYEYRIKKPGQLKAGITATGISGFDFSLSGEYTNYANLSLDLVTGNDFGFDEEVGYREDQSALNDLMADSYKQVINYKAGLGYQINEELKIKAGYAYLPGRSKVYEADRNVVSGGFTANLAENIVLDINGQYSFWQDRSIAYTYYDFDANTNRSETIDHKVSSLKILAGIRFLF